VVFFSIGSIVIGAVIAWSAGDSIADRLPAGGVAATLYLVVIFAGAVSLVGGAVLALLARSRFRRRLLLPLGVCIMIGGCAMIGLGTLSVLAAAGSLPAALAGSRPYFGQ
jgi:hypothetical protein